MEEARRQILLFVPSANEMRPWLIWQLADSGFPTGGFAHSFGLEAAWQQGEVDAATLAQFVADMLVQSGHGAIPFVTAAHARPDDVGEIDAAYDAFLRNVVANRASRVQGRAWLATIERVFPQEARAVCETARTLQARHYAPLFGETMRVLEVELHTTQQLFLFGVCRGALSAAVRLGIVGTTDAQRLLKEAAPDLERVAARTAALTIDEAAQTAPLIDLWQSGHDRLYSRLFQS